MEARITIHPIWVHTEFADKSFGPLVQKVRDLKENAYPVVPIDTRVDGVFVRDPTDGEVYFVEYRYLLVDWQQEFDAPISVIPMEA